ncbi:unnamed protein product [Nyctereutes procyonoides]|uniref:(raccoon dog) hypothetical protein n=1 Tax=Nyctereutes procyonoides TaxID=34880 RepID=A0A811Z421_NYCPR|nr:unnamed protein product [Nyctereutes procyonoides]
MWSKLISFSTELPYYSTSISLVYHMFEGAYPSSPLSQDMLKSCGAPCS